MVVITLSHHLVSRLLKIGPRKAFIIGCAGYSSMHTNQFLHLVRTFLLKDNGSVNLLQCRSFRLCLRLFIQQVHCHNHNSVPTISFFSAEGSVLQLSLSNNFMLIRPLHQSYPRAPRQLNWRPIPALGFCSWVNGCGVSDIV